MAMIDTSSQNSRKCSNLAQGPEEGLVNSWLPLLLETMVPWPLLQPPLVELMPTTCPLAFSRTSPTDILSVP